MRQRPAARDRVSELLGDGGGDDSRNPAGPPPMLARDEQEEVVGQLRRELVSHARRWRAAIGAIGLVLAASFLYFAAWQAASPWTAYRHHSQLHGTLHAAAVVVAEAASGGAIAAAAAALLRNMPDPSGVAPATAVERTLLRRALQGAAGMAAFWGATFAVAGRAGRLNGQQLLALGWLPVLPLAYVLLALAAVQQYADLAGQLKGLEEQMYNHEGA